MSVLDGADCGGVRMTPYIRGKTPLGLFNTVIQFFGIVLVLKINKVSRVVGWFFDREGNYPQIEEDENE